MQLDTLLTAERTLCRAPAVNKQEVLKSCARFFCESINADKSINAGENANAHDSKVADLDADLLLQSLLARERLGSTGLGNGIAIPHCRLKNLDRVVGALITLAEPIDFEAVDGKPVDIIFLLLAPAQALQEHLNALAALADLFNRAEFRQGLRAATDSAQLYRTAIEFQK
ncbi:MAG: PTS sugar transporter subunit IIA [Spongiibacteraceae bacterium]